MCDLLAHEWFLIKHVEVLVRFRTIAKTAVILSCRVHLHEDLLCIRGAICVQKVIGGVGIVVWIFLEAFQTLQVDDLLDNVQALQIYNNRRKGED